MAKFKYIYEKIKVREDIKIQEPSLENIELFIKLYITEGVKNSVSVGREELEEIHIYSDDDIFFEFLDNIQITTNPNGFKYIESFLEDYEVPEPPESTIIETLNRKINGHVERYQCPPKYIILSEFVFNKLRKEVIVEDLTISRTTHHYDSYMGIPIALLRGKNDVEIELIPRVGNYKATTGRPIRESIHPSVPKEAIRKDKPKVVFNKHLPK